MTTNKGKPDDNTGCTSDNDQRAWGQSQARDTDDMVADTNRTKGIAHHRRAMIPTAAGDDGHQRRALIPTAAEAMLTRERH
jgi:hypothetical protein